MDKLTIIPVMEMSVRPKYPKEIDYTVQSSWDGATGGVVLASGDCEVVFDTPETYGGKGEGVCPDELFVASLLGCLNNTFLDFQRRFNLGLLKLDLSGNAKAKFDGKGYKIVAVSISGEVVVEDGEGEIAERCVELMKEYCHLTRTICDCIPFEYDFVVHEKAED